MSGMSVAVTGASGFVGRGVVAGLEQAGLGVMPISRSAGGPGARQVADYADIEALAEAFGDASTVVHLADDPRRQEGRDTGAALAQSVAEAAARSGATRLIHASSVYARLSPQPGSYGAEKALAEEVFLARPEFRSVILRLPPVYGPGGKGGFAMLAKVIRKGLPLPLGAAKAPRDYLSRTNLSGLVAAMAAADDGTWDAMNGQMFEPSDGQPVGTADLARMMGAAMGRPARLLPVPLGLLRLLGKITGKAETIAGAIDPLATAGNGAITEAVGWTPAEQIPESLGFLRA